MQQYSHGSTPICFYHAMPNTVVSNRMFRQSQGSSGLTQPLPKQCNVIISTTILQISTFMVAFYSFVSCAHYCHSTLCLQCSLFTQHAVPAVFTIGTACCVSNSCYSQSMLCLEAQPNSGVPIQDTASCASNKRYSQSRALALPITLTGDTARCANSEHCRHSMLCE